MRAVDADVVWNPEGDVRIERHGSHWQSGIGEFWMPATCLGEFGQVKTDGDPTKQLLAVFVLFNTIVVRDRVRPEVAHKAFLKIDEYRKAISPDSPGAE